MAGLSAAPRPDAPVVLVVRPLDEDVDADEAVLDAGARDVLAWPTTPRVLARRLMVAERQVAEARRRRDAEYARARSATSFRSLLDRLPDGIAVHRDHRFVYANAVLARMLGYGTAADQLLGQPILSFIDDRRGFQGRVDEAAQGGSVPGAEEQLVRVDGEGIAVEAQHLLVDFEGAPAVLTLVRDLRERRQLEASLRQADRMASVGTLALGVAHELNNPLAYVLSNLQIAREELARFRDVLPAGFQESFRTLLYESREGVARMRQVVRDLKTFSRDSDEPVGPVALQPVLRSCVNMTRNELVHRAQLREDYQPTPEVAGNESRLGQVFINLMVNAIHSLPERHPRDNWVRVATWTDDAGRAVVEIADNGEGIPESDLARIFDPFFTTKPPGEGTGLGLSIVHNIVRGMEGEIDVETRPGEGTAFRVRMPAAVRPMRVRRSSSSSLRIPAAVPGGRVLVVDDDRMVARSLERVLREHDVVVAGGGAAALRILESDRSFDVVLCDLMMPDVSGIDVFAQVSLSDPDLSERFVFMTGGAFTAQARAFLDTVPNEHFEKPFDPNEVRLTVAARIGGAPISRPPSSG